MNQRSHIFLLTVDALRADHLPLYGYERDTAPFLTSFAKENTRFSNCFSASSHTREAVPALLTGRYPDECVNADYKLAERTVAKHLGSTGYATAAFHSNPFISRAYGYGESFDHFNDDIHFSSSRIGALAQRLLDKIRNRHYARGGDINKSALSWIDDHDGPLFVWNHYMDVHGPYQPPAEYRERYTDEPVTDRESQRLYNRTTDDPEGVKEETRQLQRDLYDGEIRYVDAAIKSFLDGLENRGLLADSLILITADHGDAFGEHGYYGHPRFLDDVVTHVPLVVSGLNEVYGDVRIPTSTLDIVPTLLSQAGVEGPDIPGIPLQSIGRDPSAYCERAVFAQARGESADEHLRRYRGFTGDDRAEVVVDRTSGEHLDVDGDPPLVDRLREHIEGRTSGEFETGVRSDEPPSAVESRLQSLGYK